MVRKYQKGYRGENELIHMLSRAGFMALRSPRSGRIGLPSPDIIAAKNGSLYAIECKSRTNGFKVYDEQLQELIQWEQTAGAKTFIAWKVSRKGWFFIPLKNVVENNGNVGKNFCQEFGMSFDDIFMR